MWVGPEDQTHLYRDSCVYLSEQVPSLGPLLSNTSKRFDHVLQKAWRQLLAARTIASLLFCVWLNDMKKKSKRKQCEQIRNSTKGVKSVTQIMAPLLCRPSVQCQILHVDFMEFMKDSTYLASWQNLCHLDICANAQMQNPSLSLHGMSHFGTKSMLKLQNHSRTFHNIDATGGKRSTWRCLSLSCLIRNLTTSCFLKEFKAFHLVMAFHLYSSFFLGTCYFLPV